MKVRIAETVVASVGLLLAAGALAPRLAEAQAVVRGTTRTSVNRNVNVNANRNVNVNRDVNVDVDRDYHPVARAATATAAVAVTAAAVGSIVHSLPPSCSAVAVGGVTYQQCGSSWYQPQYSGTQIQYVVVDPPQ
jgi:hypothetical protein